MKLLKPLLYFSLFQYPLTEEEIYTFSETTSKEQINASLEKLVREKVIFKIDEFYLFEDDKSLVKRRLSGNQMAKDIQDKADKVSKFISKFPYVEGVGISGSLSKGYYDDDDGDIDFFIITSPKRLWIARTFLILYKKIFLLNSKKYFCVNYFISTNSLEIEEKNRFTATELTTMLPMYGNGSFHDFYEQNKWVNSFLPNKTIAEGLSKLNPVEKPILSKAIEGVLDTKLGDWLDSLFLKITYKKWKIKFNKLEDKHFNVALKSTQNVSKHHPLNFQKKVIERLNGKYDELQEKHNIYLEKEHA
ncbi:MAG: nucleotidyltransferase domain-containing protein [Flavobacteriaceae bacterium]|nr:nucleotidyltransferase domain-containing protein [Flavobacteriaceae bacterium]